MKNTLSINRLKELAIDVVEKRTILFSMLKDVNLAKIVFLPVSLMEKEEIEKIGSSDLCDIIGVPDKVKFNINDIPIFSECILLKKIEREKIVEYAKEYKELKEKFLSD